MALGKYQKVHIRCNIIFFYFGIYSLYYIFTNVLENITNVLKSSNK